MKKSCLLGILAALSCAAQQKPMYRGEIVTSSMAEMGGSYSGNPEARQTVSVAQLRHKVPQDAQKEFLRGQKSSLAGNHQAAVQELESAVARDGEFAEAHAALGAEYAQLTRFAEAEAELKRAIALDPASSSYYDLGLVYFRTGDMQAAETAVRKALESPQSQPTTHLLLAYILMRDPARRDETERHLRYAAKTIPQADYLLHKLRESRPHS